MFRNSDLHPFLRSDAAADRPDHRPWTALPERLADQLDDRPSLLLIGGQDWQPDLAAMAEGANFRLIGAAALDESASRLGKTVALDALLVDLRGVSADDMGLDRAIHAVLAWPGLGDVQLLVLADLAALDAAIAALGTAEANILCEPGQSDIATALCFIAGDRRRLVTLHDVSRDSENPRLEQLSEEVRRLAQIIDRLTQDGGQGHGSLGGGGQQNGGQGEANRLGDMQMPYALAPASFGGAPMRRAPARGGSGGVITREEVRALLQARRLRDRYLPADLFADPAWDMMLDLMAARLAGKRVSVSSLCIAAAVPPTTALRWIGQLTERGIFVRSNDPDDARRVFITLSEEAAESLAAWFAAIGRAGLRFSG